MVAIKNGDFVELDFVGRIKSTGQIFDLTVEDVAKKEGIADDRSFEPMIACVGSGHLIQGFDEQITGKEIGSELEFDLPAEKGFGRKNPKLIQLTSLAMFKKRNIHPVPGIQLNIDGTLATVRSVSGGRVILDFNHPLAGKELHYWVKIRKIITDTKKKAESLVSILNIPADVSITGNNVSLKLKEDTPKEMQDVISEQFKNNLPELKLSFK
jgi:FKBP-type peptidyl-prolyl cis-trans isomerase 2